MAKNTTKKSSGAATMMALGAAAVALAASSYYLFGPEGKIHRKKAAGWMLKMKGEIIEKLEEAGEVSEAAYHTIIDAVLATYVASGKIAAPELTAFATGLKGQWKNIVKTLNTKGANLGPKKPKKMSGAKMVKKGKKVVAKGKKK